MSESKTIPPNYLTVFNGKPSAKNPKHAFSPYFDKTFIFKTYRFDSYDNVAMYDTLVSYWTLNIPLEKLDEPIRTYRRKAYFEPFLGEKLTYFILDLDKVKTKEAQDTILEYFSTYKCIIGESKSYDGKVNFNMKGVLFIEPIDMKDAKQAIANLNLDLTEYCEVDEAVARIASLNAPIGKNKVLLNRDKYLYKCKFEQILNKIEDGYINIDKKKQKVDIGNITGANLEEYCINVFKSMGFEPMQVQDNGAIQFKHPAEVKSVGGFFWFSNSPYTMHHYNATRSINIFDAVRQTDAGKEFLNVGLDYDDKFLHFNTATKVINVNEKYLSVKDKEDDIQTFLENKDGLYSIKSPMGTAKSTIIQYIIEEAHNLDQRVLIITNRISVAIDFKTKYGMKIYNKDTYENGDSIIVQFDSLWKYDIQKFDLVIMDEFISLMCHSRNNLGNSSLNLAKFFGAFNKKLVIADAFLTGYENFLLENKTSNVFLLNNEWRDKTTLYSYQNKNFFFQKLLHTAREQKVTVSGTSLNFLQSTKSLLEKHGLKCILLTASTPETTKELIYELFTKEEHDKWDVFLYSPSLTVGVSNLNNVFHHFHFDTSMSTDVISSIQMIKRTRKAKEIHMHISDRINYLKTTYDSVRDEYMGNIGKNIDQNFLFDVDNYGTQKLSKIGVNAIKIDTFKNILEFNHKKAMFWMMKHHFFGEPREVDIKFEGNILSKYSKELKNNKEAQQTQNISDFLALSNSEKMDILIDNNADAIMKNLAMIEENIKPDVNMIIKKQILEICIKDKQFVHKCLNYKVAKNYTDKFIGTAEIKSKISDAMINNTDTKLLTALLAYGQNPIKEFYVGTPDKKLLNILAQCGFKKGPKELVPTKDIELMCEFEKNDYLQRTQKVLRVQPEVKNYYGYLMDI